MQMLERLQTQFAKYKRQITRFDTDVERVEGFITLQLDLKSKHTSLQEAHLTALINAAVIKIIIVTITFPIYCETEGYSYQALSGNRIST